MMFDWSNRFLLATKLTMPRSYVRKVVPRLHLQNKLDGGIAVPLTLVSAPAGSGKTTLICEWARQSDVPLAWITFEHADNDGQRFWSYIGAALEKLHGPVSEHVRDFLQSSATAPIEDGLSALINTLMALPVDVLLVLDDFQMITAQEIHHSLTFLLEHMPPKLHLLIATRVDPPLPLSQMRVRGQLIELRASDLRFSFEETAAFLQHATPLMSAHIAALSKRAEGWIGGLQLAALTLQGQHDGAEIAQLIETFTGTNRHVLHYLTEEVLAPLPAEVQTFLVATSILPRMNAALCDIVTGQGNGELMLERLELSNLFITALDEPGRWYCYHPLFADFLRHRLRHTHSNRVVELHARASAWYEQQHMIDDAVEHALAAADYERAAYLIEHCIPSLPYKGYAVQVQSWLVKLQDQVALADHPSLSLLYASMFLLKGHDRAYEQTISIAEQAWREAQNGEMLSTVLALRAHAALFYGDGEQAICYAEQALALAQDSTSLSGSAHVYLAGGHLLCGDLLQAHAALLQARRSYRVDNQAQALPGWALYMGDLHLCQGRVDEAIAYYQQGTQENSVPISWDRARAFFRLGEIYCERNKLERADELLQQGMRLVEDASCDWLRSEGYMLSSRLAWIRGERAATMAWLEWAEDEALCLDKRRVYLARIITRRVWYLLASGNVSAAQFCLEHYMSLPMEQMFLFEREAWSLTRARLFIAQGQAEEAIAILGHVLQSARVQGRIHSEIALLVVQVQAYAMIGDTRNSRQALECALARAEPGRYCHVFVNEGEAMASQLASFYHRQQKRCASDVSLRTLTYVREMLNLLGQEIEEQPVSNAAKRTRQVVVEQGRVAARTGLFPGSHLSEREQEVLNLIAAGQSNQEIARTLVVAESTIKTHLNNIYTKLNVSSRLQALTTAHAYGLLEL